jgi:hypothetical protein
MNERIKQLAEQANIKLDYFGNGIDIDGGNPNVSEFAKLIIKECYEICRNNVTLLTEYDSDEAYNYNEGASDCAIHIKEHFGVEL